MNISYRDYFCNFCGTMLALSSSKFLNNNKNNYQSSNVELQCMQCQQRYRDCKAISSTSFIPLRQILKAEIIRDSEQWANASSTTEPCPKCTNEKAYYLQIQTRSADEPMTTYYRCSKCAHNWSDR